MTPNQYRAVLSRLGCSIRRAGKVLGTTERNSFRWAAGREPPPSVLKLLALAEAGKVTLDDIERATVQ